MAVQILSKGARSTVFLDENEPEFVIKQAKDPKDYTYLTQQQHGYNIIESIKAQNKEFGVTLPELVEINDKEQTIKEKIMHGTTFNNDNVYLGLSEQHRNDIAKQMATFLNAMHSSSKCLPAQEPIINMQQKEPKNADEIIAKFDGLLPKNIVNKLKQAEEYLRTSEISDELVVMTHKDLRISNLMYDVDTNKLAVIDFESAGMDNVYRDFIARAPASSMPWDFTKRVIDYYNQIPNKKYPIKINPEKVQNMLLYGVLHEYARCIKPNDNIHTTVTRLLRKLPIITGVNFDTKQLYDNAIKKIQTISKKEQPSIEIQNNIEREDR